MKAIIYLLMWMIPFQTHPKQNDPQAEKLLNKVWEKFQSYKTVQVEFEYELYNPEARVKQNTNGRVFIQGNKYRAEYMGMTDIFDGKKRYLIVPENKEINIFTPEDDEEITPASLFKFFKKGYRYKMDILQNAGGRKIRYIKLFPIKDDNEIDYVLLGIDTKTYHIYKAIIVQKDKTRITIYIKKFKPNVPLGAKEFVFDKTRYPGYMINDLD